MLNPEEESLLVQKMTTLKETEYQEITKKYVSEADIILYVMNSTNPIKESHTKINRFIK